MIDLSTPVSTATLQASEIQMVWSLCMAALLGSILGLERSLAGKQAGMRTYALVSIGSCLFVGVGTLASYFFAPNFSGINPLQLAGSIIVGVGFIGSGLAVLRGGGHAELTTAAGIWVIAGVGMACGFGLYILATVATVLAAAVFSLFLRIENGIRRTYTSESAAE